MRVEKIVGVYPGVLAEELRKYLGIPASSAASERELSPTKLIARQALSKTRKFRNAAFPKA